MPEPRKLAPGRAIKTDKASFTEEQVAGMISDADKSDDADKKMKAGELRTTKDNLFLCKSEIVGIPSMCAWCKP